MKKILISILFIILAVLIYFLVFKNISVFEWKSTSVTDIKDMDAKLNSKIDEAVTISNLNYPESIETLEGSIRNLKLAKQEYENKMKYVSENVELGVVQVKQYKIERLWIVLENYAKDRGIELKLEVVDANTSKLYDLKVTLVGDYIGITDFIYDIENDDTLEFNISNFKLVAENQEKTDSTSNNEEKKNNEDSNKTENKENEAAKNKLKATFEIEGVGIQFN